MSLLANLDSLRLAWPLSRELNTGACIEVEPVFTTAAVEVLEGFVTVDSLLYLR